MTHDFRDDLLSPLGSTHHREMTFTYFSRPQREKLIHELEEERRLRLESEKRLREVTEESELGRAQMVSLQQQFSREEKGPEVESESDFIDFIEGPQ